MTMTEDFGDEMAQSVSIAPFQSNDGYDDTYGTAVSYSCAVQHKVKNITTADGTVAVSTMQIYLDGSVAVTARDNVIYNGTPIRVLAVGIDYDIESPSEVYSKVIYS